MRLKPNSKRHENSKNDFSPLFVHRCLRVVAMFGVDIPRASKIQMSKCEKCSVCHLLCFAFWMGIKRFGLMRRTLSFHFHPNRGISDKCQNEHHITWSSWHRMLTQQTVVYSIQSEWKFSVLFNSMIRLVLVPAAKLKCFVAATTDAVCKSHRKH